MASVVVQRLLFAVAEEVGYAMDENWGVMVGGKDGKRCEGCAWAKELGSAPDFPRLRGWTKVRPMGNPDVRTGKRLNGRSFLANQTRFMWVGGDGGSNDPGIGVV